MTIALTLKTNPPGVNRAGRLFSDLSPRPFVYPPQPSRVRGNPLPVGFPYRWRRGQSDIPGRPELIRRLVELGLKAKGK
jgi:hypothetical protein